MKSTLQRSESPDPDLVLAEVQALRPRMRELMGAEWPAFARQLDRLYSRAATASGAKRERLVEDLLRFGLASPVAEVFAEVVARATVASAVNRPRRGAELRRDILESVTRRIEAARAELERQHEMTHSSSRAARPPSQYEEAIEETIERSGPIEEAAFDRESESFRGAPGGAAPSRARPELRSAARPRAKGRARPKAKRLSRPKARRAGRAGRTKAKLAPRPKAKSAGRRSHPKSAPRRTAAAPPQAAPPVSPPRKRSRFVNLNFASLKGEAIRPTKPLVAKQAYKLRVSIGEQERKSIVEKASAKPVPDDLLPPNVDGHWLEVAAVSNEFNIPSLARWLFLPKDGPAWACRCKPGGGHKCKPSNRHFDLQFPVRAPHQTGPATLRLTIYFQKAILQSLLVTAIIARVSSGRGSNKAMVDYNLTMNLTDVDLVKPKALSVMMNDADDGSHIMIFNGAPNEVAAVHLNDDQMTSALGVMRDVMRNIHIEDRGPRDVDKVNRYDPQNRKPREKFISDLKELAARGYELWNTLWYEKSEQWIKNRKLFVEGSDAIHIGRKSRSTSAFPWAIVYDLPIEIGAPENYHLCELLDKTNWENFQAASGDVPTRCPFESNHGENVICPFGFWGIRYEIEQPPSLQKGRSLPRSIPVDPPPLNFVIALSDDLDAQLLATHLETLREQTHGFQLREYRTRNDIRKGLGIPAIEVVYFYCHGYTNPLPGDAGSRPSLGVGKKEVIAPTDLTTWRMKWSDDHWQTTAPLVFINGCHTADTTPQTLVNFVDIFSATLHASGVIGTEITVHQLVANEVAQTFLKEFQLGHSVGKSLRQARGSLLRKGNLLGLVYTAYCSADLQLAAGVA